MLIQQNANKCCKILVNFLPYICLISFHLLFTQQLPSISQNIPSNHNQSQQLTKNCIKFTNTFCLKATLFSNELHLILIDFNQWILYQRSYSLSDIGGQINRKIDLDQIVNVFYQKKYQYRDHFLFMQYHFGTLQKSNDGQPLFIINQNGNIIVYVTMEKKNAKQLLKSDLNLFKIRNLNQFQIISIKSQIQRRQILTIVTNQLNKIKQQNIKLTKLISQISNKYQQLLTEICSNDMKQFKNKCLNNNKQLSLQNSVHVIF